MPGIDAYLVRIKSPGGIAWNLTSSNCQNLHPNLRALQNVPMYSTIMTTTGFKIPINITFIGTATAVLEKSMAAIFVPIRSSPPQGGYGIWELLS